MMGCNEYDYCRKLSIIDLVAGKGSMGQLPSLSHCCIPLIYFLLGKVDCTSVNISQLDIIIEGCTCLKT